jgi:hypothetical protein
MKYSKFQTAATIVNFVSIMIVPVVEVIERL